MRIYISGPMTGLPNDNRPAFREMAATLRSLGHEVVSPDELDTTHGPRNSHAEYMRRDIPLLATCDAIVTLPGWGLSVGARAEVYNAELMGIPHYRLVDGTLVSHGDSGLYIGQRQLCAI